MKPLRTRHDGIRFCPYIRPAATPSSSNTVGAYEAPPSPLQTPALPVSDTCEDYQTYLASHGITCSISRRADCYDNAVMEAFFSTVKREEAERFPSYGDAKMALFDYIEVFYNQRRRHSTLGKISPASFERNAAA